MILNLTQHVGTPDQGVTDLTGEARECLIALLTVDALPTREEIEQRANDIVLLAIMNGLGPDDGEDPVPARAMIGGAPWMMSALEDALIDAGIEPVYAFSVRESTEQKQADGSVRKINTFRHAGWVPAR